MPVKLRVISVLVFLIFVAAALTHALLSVLIGEYLPTWLFLAMFPVIILSLYGLTNLHGKSQRALSRYDIEYDPEVTP